MKKIFLYIKELRLYDKALLIYLIILFLRVAHSLFTTATGEEASVLDIIVRTNAAAIFGYFIGGGFLCRGKSCEEAVQNDSKKYVNQQFVIVFIIGFFRCF